MKSENALKSPLSSVLGRRRPSNGGHISRPNITLHIKVLQLLQYDELSADWIRVISVMRQSRNGVAHGERGKKTKLTSEKVDALLKMCLQLSRGTKEFDEKWKDLWIPNGFCITYLHIINITTTQCIGDKSISHPAFFLMKPIVNMSITSKINTFLP